MSPRGRLRLMLRPTPTTPTDTTDSATLVTTGLDTPDSLATPATPTLTTTALATPTTPMPWLPRCLPLQRCEHRRPCPRCHPRCRRSLRRSWTLLRQLCWSYPLRLSLAGLG